jgi:Na+/H+ antiporter NhaD/arsenite permease-like protein
MVLVIVCVFIIGYLLITFEHFTKIDKLIPALLMMTLSWAVISMNIADIQTWFDSLRNGFSDISYFKLQNKRELLNDALLHHFGKTAEILIFLMGAMTIVELIDHFDGFQVFQRYISTNKKYKLLWIVSLLSFFLSAIIDNLTATIVMITILRKIVPDKEMRWWYAGFVIIAANAGGAWTPIGDVTTTMLWIAGKVSTGKLAIYLFIPSFLSLIIPLFFAKFMKAFKGTFDKNESPLKLKKNSVFMLVVGILAIIFVPIFKTITHLPPYVGMMFSLSIYAIVSEVMSKRMIKLTYGKQTEEITHHSPTLRAISKIEMTSVLFFLGILMTVASMETLGIIHNIGEQVSNTLPEWLFVFLIGVFSAVVDNVPLVAASMGMFTQDLDASVWHMIAFSAGTGGSLLIIGSAAGVVVMGLEQISFGWYIKRIAPLAFAGFLAGFLSLLFIF